MRNEKGEFVEDYRRKDENNVEFEEKC